MTISVIIGLVCAGCSVVGFFVGVVSGYRVGRKHGYDLGFDAGRIPIR